jgi:hypothetical protein
MKKLIITLLLAAPALAGNLARFVRVADAQTIVVERDRMQVAVTLAGVEVAPADDAAARAWLAQTLAGRWLLVEDGIVYRSPDALCINNAMREHGWLYPDNRRERELGELDPEPRSTRASTTARATGSARRPARRTSPRTSRRSAAGPRRG